MLYNLLSGYLVQYLAPVEYPQFPGYLFMAYNTAIMTGTRQHSFPILPKDLTFRIRKSLCFPKKKKDFYLLLSGAGCSTFTISAILAVVVHVKEIGKLQGHVPIPALLGDTGGSCSIIVVLVE